MLESEGVRVCLSERERERERELKCVLERERGSQSVCQRERKTVRERECITVCNLPLVSSIELQI